MAGGLTAGRQYIKACLEDVKILQQGGCRVKGKWTPFHKGILGMNVVTHLPKKKPNNQSDANGAGLPSPGSNPTHTTK